jgi:hypothetical protein
LAIGDNGTLPVLKRYYRVPNDITGEADGSSA